MADETTQPAKTPESVGLKPDNIAQIRELLFGSFQRETVARLTRIEQRAEQIKSDADESVTLVREKLDSQIELLRKKVDQDLGHLNERLNKQIAEANERIASGEQAQAEIDRKQDEALAREIADLAARLKAAEDHLHAELRAEAKQAQRGLDALRTDVDDAVRALTDGKTNRIDLADHLIEIGARLKAASDLGDVEAQLASLAAAAGASKSDG